jgi:ribosomal protein L31
MNLHGLPSALYAVRLNLNSEMQSWLSATATDAMRSTEETLLRAGIHTQSTRKTTVNTVTSNQYTSVSSTLTTSTVIDTTMIRLTYRHYVQTATVSRPTSTMTLTQAYFRQQKRGPRFPKEPRAIASPCTKRLLFI